MIRLPEHSARLGAKPDSILQKMRDGAVSISEPATRFKSILQKLSIRKCENSLYVYRSDLQNQTAQC